MDNKDVLYTLYTKKAILSISSLLRVQDQVLPGFGPRPKPQAWNIHRNLTLSRLRTNSIQRRLHLWIVLEKTGLQVLAHHFYFTDFTQPIILNNSAMLNYHSRRYVPFRWYSLSVDAAMPLNGISSLTDTLKGIFG